MPPASAGGPSLLDESGLLDLVRAIPSDLEGPDFLEALYEGLRTKTHYQDDFDDDISAALLEYGGP